MRTERRPLFGFLFRLLWRISVVWAVVSGFAHLPVIYRYAEAALPWLRPAAYSGTVAHYWAAAAMLCLTSYAAIVWLVRGTRSYSLTPFGMLRLVLLALLMLSRTFPSTALCTPSSSMATWAVRCSGPCWSLSVWPAAGCGGIAAGARGDGPAPELVSHALRYGLTKHPSLRITKKDALRASFLFARLSAGHLFFCVQRGAGRG